ncbi:hypothetical protein ABH930_007091 [Kitasatospora sp. GAS204A]|nr:hypothetical protein [Kitasatospora sp. GAS204B]
MCAITTWVPAHNKAQLQRRPAGPGPRCDHRLTYPFNSPWALKSYGGQAEEPAARHRPGHRPRIGAVAPEHHYLATRHRQDDRGPQQLTRQALDVPRVRDSADAAVIKADLDTPANQRQQARRPRPERVLALALWPDRHRLALAL